jgi:hypothetical protein
LKDTQRNTQNAALNVDQFWNIFCLVVYSVWYLLCEFCWDWWIPSIFKYLISCPSKKIQSAKTILLPFKNGNFYNIAIAILDISLLLPFSYRSSNYWSFTLLKALAKSNGNLFAFAFKSEKERQLSLSR